MSNGKNKPKGVEQDVSHREDLRGSDVLSNVGLPGKFGWPSDCACAALCFCAASCGEMSVCHLPGSVVASRFLFAQISTKQYTQ